jgi:protein-tyrosine phosphatase
MAEKYQRQIEFENVPNFRDIGGYRAKNGKKVAWRRVFRSGELRSMTRRDLVRLKEELGLAAIIDLRSEFEVKHRGRGRLKRVGIKYYNVPFIPDGGQPDAELPRYEGFTCMGELYVDLVRQKGFGKRIVEALEIIAAPENHPLVFHCAAGKDRTGILAAVLLDILGVADEDIKNDYSLSGAYIEALIKQLRSVKGPVDDVMKLPDFFWTATPESMAMLLTCLRRENGSIRAYLRTNGAMSSLFVKLRRALLDR